MPVDLAAMNGGVEIVVHGKVGVHTAHIEADIACGDHERVEGDGDQNTALGKGPNRVAHTDLGRVEGSHEGKADEKVDDTGENEDAARKYCCHHVQNADAGVAGVARALAGGDMHAADIPLDKEGGAD